MVVVSISNFSCIAKDTKPPTGRDKSLRKEGQMEDKATSGVCSLLGKAQKTWVAVEMGVWPKELGSSLTLSARISTRSGRQLKQRELTGHRPFRTLQLGEHLYLLLRPLLVFGFSIELVNCETVV